MRSDCVPQLSPLKFSLVWTTQMALLFTVVLSACPSRISQSHNPLFIPTEAQSVCKWTWVMADEELLTSPPIQGNHAASNTHRKTHVWMHIFILRHRHAHTENERALAQTIQKEREQMRKVFVFFFLNITSSFLCSPCVFMSCHLVKRLYGLPRPHGNECGEVDCGSFRTPPGPALRASDKRVSPESFSLQTGKLFNLTSSPIPIFFLLFFPLSTSIGSQKKVTLPFYVIEEYKSNSVWLCRPF